MLILEFRIHWGSTAVPYGHWLMFQLLHFCFSSLLVVWEKQQQKMLKYLGCCHLRVSIG